MQTLLCFYFQNLSCDASASPLSIGRTSDDQSSSPPEGDRMTECRRSRRKLRSSNVTVNRIDTASTPTTTTTTNANHGTLVIPEIPINEDDVRCPWRSPTPQTSCSASDSPLQLPVKHDGTIYSFIIPANESPSRNTDQGSSERTSDNTSGAECVNPSDARSDEPRQGDTRSHQATSELNVETESQYPSMCERSDLLGQGQTLNRTSASLSHTKNEVNYSQDQKSRIALALKGERNVDCAPTYDGSKFCGILPSVFRYCNSHRSQLYSFNSDHGSISCDRMRIRLCIRCRCLGGLVAMQEHKFCIQPYKLTLIEILEKYGHLMPRIVENRENKDYIMHFMEDGQPSSSPQLKNTHHPNSILLSNKIHQPNITPQPNSTHQESGIPQYSGTLEANRISQHDCSPVLTYRQTELNLWKGNVKLPNDETVAVEIVCPPDLAFSTECAKTLDFGLWQLSVSLHRILLPSVIDILFNIFKEYTSSMIPLKLRFESDQDNQSFSRWLVSYERKEYAFAVLCPTANSLSAFSENIVSHVVISKGPDDQWVTYTPKNPHIYRKLLDQIIAYGGLSTSVE